MQDILPGYPASAWCFTEQRLPALQEKHTERVYRRKVMAIQNPVTLMVVDANGNSVVLESTNGGVHVAESGFPSVDSDRFGDTIGYASGLEYKASWTQAEDVRWYQVYPSVDMRIAEDQINLPSARAALNVGAAPTPSETGRQTHTFVKGAQWSKIFYLDRDADLPSLTNLYFSLDAAGTGATVRVRTG